MKLIQDSYIYHIWLLVRSWFSNQWESSVLVHFLTNQKESLPAGAFACRIARSLRSWLTALCEKLKLGKLLDGSIFLHPEWFAAAAVILAPLLPTMAVLALVCAGFFALVLKLGLDREMRIPSAPINGYVLLYGIIYLYATITSVSLSGSLFPGLLTIAFVLFFFVVTACFQKQDQLRKLVGAMVLVGVVLSFYGFYQVMFPEKFRSVWTDTDMFSSITFRVYSTLENPNVLGEYFLLIIPLGAAMLLTAENWKGRIGWLAACGVMGVCLILTYSRGCYLGLLFAAAVFLVLLDRRFLVVGIIAVALCPLYLPESVLTRFTSIGNMGDTSTSYRVYIWMGTLAMLKDYWFCGVGPGVDAYNVVYPEYAYNAVTAPHSHSLYLQLVCDTGSCGLVVFLLIIISFYRRMFTALRHGVDRRAKTFQIAGVASVTGFLVQSATDFTFYNYRVLFLFWCVMALSVCFSRLEGKSCAEDSTCLIAEEAHD